MSTDPDEPRQLRECVHSFLAAQKRRERAYEHGVYELDEDEGHRCGDCGGQDLWARGDIVDETEPSDNDVLTTVCRSCGSPNLVTGETTAATYQQFGYEFTELPTDIPPGEEDAYRVEDR